MNKKILFVISFVIFCGVFIVVSKPTKTIPVAPPTIPQPPTQYNISKVSGYLSYPEIIQKLKIWKQEAPEITEFGNYGVTTKNHEIVYLKVGKGNIKVLITACIHGNEKIANAVVMGILEKYLTDFGRDPKITKLINEREVYWVPVVSPDSFITDQRHVDGVDPNRNFPYPSQPNIDSVPPIRALREFFIQKQFKAALSTHAYGRLYIFPFGYTNKQAPHHQTFRDICGRMGEMARYRSEQINNIQTAPPYHGFEADWFYANGAFGMVAEVGMEFTPSATEIAPEVNRNYRPYLLFIEEAPLVIGP